MAAGADPTFLLRALIRLAGQEHEHLTAGEWEAAVAVRHDFDQAFETLQRSVGAHKMPPGCNNELMRLHKLHADNLRLVRELQATAGDALAELTKVSQIGGYAPLGSGHQPAPRYLDHSA